MTTRLKIVPLNEPNAPGEWIEVDRDIPYCTSRKWLDVDLYFRDLVPAGFVMVAFERGRGC